MEISRRQFMKQIGNAALLSSSLSATASANFVSRNANSPAVNKSKINCFTTTQSEAWQSLVQPTIVDMDNGERHDVSFYLELDNPKQTMEGFGGSFSELGYDALSALPQETQQEILSLLFAEPNATHEMGHSGANFNLCRTPMGASDFALKWYSYAETPSDFALNNFSVDNDKNTLIPYIQAAQNMRSDLKVWGSPWSPPVWMKTNGHYAMRENHSWAPSNGIKPEQMGTEGNDYFNLSAPYLNAYAKYFTRYIEEYRKNDINIQAVMPQNEFNSAQAFPSCCWTPDGLNQFIPLLGEEMAKLDVDLLFGTLERPSIELVDRVMEHEPSRKHIKGIGVQWAGKGALPLIDYKYNDLAIWGTEQECGDGKNDWRYARYTWELMKTYLLNGSTGYEYWNMILSTEQQSSWGWPQNSLVTIDKQKQSFRLNYEYFLMRHLSAYVQRGANMIPATSWTGYSNQLAFLNPDDSVVIMLQNPMSSELKLTTQVAGKAVKVTLPADSFTTVHLPQSLYA